MHWFVRHRATIILASTFYVVCGPQEAFALPLLNQTNCRNMLNSEFPLGRCLSLANSTASPKEWWTARDYCGVVASKLFAQPVAGRLAYINSYPQVYWISRIILNSSAIKSASHTWIGLGIAAMAQSNSTVCSDIYRWSNVNWQNMQKACNSSAPALNLCPCYEAKVGINKMSCSYNFTSRIAVSNKNPAQWNQLSATTKATFMCEFYNPQLKENCQPLCPTTTTTTTKTTTTTTTKTTTKTTTTLSTTKTTTKTTTSTTRASSTTTKTSSRTTTTTTALPSSISSTKFSTTSTTVISTSTVAFPFTSTSTMSSKTSSGSSSASATTTVPKSAVSSTTLSSVMLGVSSPFNTAPSSTTTTSSMPSSETAAIITSPFTSRTLTSSASPVTLSVTYAGTPAKQQVTTLFSATTAIQHSTSTNGSASTIRNLSSSLTLTTSSATLVGTTSATETSTLPVTTTAFQFSTSAPNSTSDSTFKATTPSSRPASRALSTESASTIPTVTTVIESSFSITSMQSSTGLRVSSSAPRGASITNTTMMSSATAPTSTGTTSTSTTPIIITIARMSNLSSTTLIVTSTFSASATQGLTTMSPHSTASSVTISTNITATKTISPMYSRFARTSADATSTSRLATHIATTAFSTTASRSTTPLSSSATRSVSTTSRPNSTPTVSTGTTSASAAAALTTIITLAASTTASKSTVSQSSASLIMITTSNSLLTATRGTSSTAIPASRVTTTTITSSLPTVPTSSALSTTTTATQTSTTTLNHVAKTRIIYRSTSITATETSTKTSIQQTKAFPASTSMLPATAPASTMSTTLATESGSTTSASRSSAPAITTNTSKPLLKTSRDSVAASTAATQRPTQASASSSVEDTSSTSTTTSPTKAASSSSRLTTPRDSTTSATHTQTFTTTWSAQAISFGDTISTTINSNFKTASSPRSTTLKGPTSSFTATSLMAASTTKTSIAFSAIATGTASSPTTTASLSGSATMFSTKTARSTSKSTRGNSSTSTTVIEAGSTRKNVVTKPFEASGSTLGAQSLASSVATSVTQSPSRWTTVAVVSSRRKVVATSSGASSWDSTTPAVVLPTTSQASTAPAVDLPTASTVEVTTAPRAIIKSATTSGSIKGIFTNAGVYSETAGNVTQSATEVYFGTPSQLSQGTGSYLPTNSAPESSHTTTHPEQFPLTDTLTMSASSRRPAIIATQVTTRAGGAVVAAAPVSAVTNSKATTTSGIVPGVTMPAAASTTTATSALARSAAATTAALTFAPATPATAASALTRTARTATTATATTIESTTSLATRFATSAYRMSVKPLLSTVVTVSEAPATTGTTAAEGAQTLHKTVKITQDAKMTRAWTKTSSSQPLLTVSATSSLLEKTRVATAKATSAASSRITSLGATPTARTPPTAATTKAELASADTTIRVESTAASMLSGRVAFSTPMSTGGTVSGKETTTTGQMADSVASHSYAKATTEEAFRANYADSAQALATTASTEIAEEIVRGSAAYGTHASSAIPRAQLSTRLPAAVSETTKLSTAATMPVISQTASAKVLTFSEKSQAGLRAVTATTAHMAHTLTPISVNAPDQMMNSSTQIEHSSIPASKEPSNDFFSASNYPLKTNAIMTSVLESTTDELAMNVGMVHTSGSSEPEIGFVSLPPVFPETVPVTATSAADTDTAAASEKTSLATDVGAAAKEGSLMKTATTAKPHASNSRTTSRPEPGTEIVSTKTSASEANMESVTKSHETSALTTTDSVEQQLLQTLNSDSMETTHPSTLGLIVSEETLSAGESTMAPQHATARATTLSSSTTIGSAHPSKRATVMSEATTASSEATSHPWTESTVRRSTVPLTTATVTTSSPTESAHATPSNSASETRTAYGNDATTETQSKSPASPASSHSQHDSQFVTAESPGTKPKAVRTNPPYAESEPARTVAATTAKEASPASLSVDIAFPAQTGRSMTLANTASLLWVATAATLAAGQIGSSIAEYSSTSALSQLDEAVQFSPRFSTTAAEMSTALLPSVAKQTTEPIPIAQERQKYSAENLGVCVEAGWADWGNCTAGNCSDGRGTRTRRQQTLMLSTGPACPDSRLAEESEPCTVEACDQLSILLKKIIQVIMPTGCIILASCLAFNLFLIGTVLRDYSYERLLAASHEVSLFVAHLLICYMYNRVELKIACTVTAASLQYLHLVTFAFILIEMNHACDIMTNQINRISPTVAKLSIAAGWAIPGVFTAINFILQHASYTSEFSCWANYDDAASPGMVGVAYPISFVSLVAVVLCERAALPTIQDTPEQKEAKARKAEKNAQAATIKEKLINKLAEDILPSEEEYRKQNVHIENKRQPLTSEDIWIRAHIIQKWMPWIVILNLSVLFVGSTAAYYRLAGLHMIDFGLKCAMGAVYVVANISAVPKMFNWVVDKWNKYCCCKTHTPKRDIDIYDFANGSDIMLEPISVTDSHSMPNVGCSFHADVACTHEDIRCDYPDYEALPK